MTEQSLPLLRFFLESFAPLKLRSRSPRTKQLYLSSIRTFGKFLERPATCADLTDDMVSRFLLWFREKGRSPYSVNKEHANLTAIWRFAFRRKVVDAWPTVERDVEPERIPQAWTHADLTAILTAIRAEPGEVAGVPAAKWWRALHLLAWDTGERIGAILQVTRKNVDLREGYVLFPAETRKGGRKSRLAKIRAVTMAALREIWEPAREKMFPWELSATYIYHRYERILRRADLPCDAKSKFHRIRKSVGSYLKVQGVNVTEFFGHSSARVTEAYIDPRIAKDVQASDILPPIDEGKS